MSKIKCKDCIHNSVCYMQEVCNDIEQQIKEFGCADFKEKSKFISIDDAVNEGYLCDWYIASVYGEPIWTEAHIAELYRDFILIPREDAND